MLECTECYEDGGGLIYAYCAWIRLSRKRENVRRKLLIADMKKDKCTAITNLNYYLLKLISDLPPVSLT